MATVTSADGTRIAFERSGNGPPLVLVHGATTDHNRWKRVRSALEQRLTVYVVDRRGRGGSGDADVYAIEREFEDVMAVVDSIDEPVHLLGHSFEGYLYAGGRSPDRQPAHVAPVRAADHDRRQPADHTDALARMQGLRDDGEDGEALLVFFREIVSVPPAEFDALRAAPN